MAYTILIIGVLHIIGVFLYLHFLAMAIANHYPHCQHKETCHLVNTTTTQAYIEAFFWPIFTLIWEYRRWAGGA